MRTKAVKVFNSVTEKLTCAHTALQATLISDGLKDELGLKTASDTSVTLRTLADQKVFCRGRINFKLESLYSDEQFTINDALVVPRFLDDVSTLSHAVDSSTLGHFNRVHISVATERKRMNVLIGQSDNSFLTVLEERKIGDPKEPNYVLSDLDPLQVEAELTERLIFLIL